MSEFLEQIFRRAKADKQTIVLPEGSDKRTLEAARALIDEDIAHIYVLGSEEGIASHGISLDGIKVIDPKKSKKTQAYAEKLAELRRSKGMSIEQALELVQDVTYFGVMMVYMEDADGMVSGACHSTADTLRPCLQILKTAPGTKLVSSVFVMDVPNCELGENGLFVFGDCGLNQYPTAEELSEIALASAHTFETLCEAQPRVAMLSYSSYGSAKSEQVNLVQEATKLAQEKEPHFMLDGELQLDAAIVPEVGASKAPESDVAGKANVLIFPNLDAGNIGYKLTQRLAKADAFGPITQGLSKPVNDLSRGCYAADIVGVVAITCVQSQQRKSGL